ncbi:MAG: dipeptide ABC transporter ATP-binding protein [Alphaproteobacteria bacterium]|nr:dipeptide ABC transporter ATP-binding protein [Alphaproteobacteria bacterium]
MTDPVLIEARGLTKHFPLRKGFILGRNLGTVRAVDGVDFDIRTGETLALVGESGCGKSTTGRLLLRLVEPTAGSIRYKGEDVAALAGEALRARRRDLQIIFQDPVGSLNPRMTVGEILAEPLVIHGIGDAAGRARRVRELLSLVGLAQHHARRYPHEFSGGQRQRVGIARALALQPAFLVCDEPVSALDVSIQAQIINLMQELQRELRLTYLFISHNLAVVRHIASRVAVMYLGRIVELAETDELFARPRHPYTQALLSAVPTPDPDRPRRRIQLQGDVPSPINPPAGCRFHTRCPLAEAQCRIVEPVLHAVAPGHAAACHLVRPIS